MTWRAHRNTSLQCIILEFEYNTNRLRSPTTERANLRRFRDGQRPCKLEYRRTLGWNFQPYRSRGMMAAPVTNAFATGGPSGPLLKWPDKSSPVSRATAFHDEQNDSREWDGKSTVTDS